MRIALGLAVLLGWSKVACCWAKQSGSSVAACVPDDEDGVATGRTRPFFARLPCVDGKPKARSRRGVGARRERGRERAASPLVGPGRSARCPGQRTRPQTGRWAAWGEPQIAEHPSAQSDAYVTVDLRGAAAQRPVLRAGKGAESSLRRPWPMTRPATAGRPLTRAQRGAPLLGAWDSSRDPNRRPDVQSGAKAVRLLPRSGFALPVRPPANGQSNWYFRYTGYRNDIEITDANERWAPSRPRERD